MAKKTMLYCDGCKKKIKRGTLATKLEQFKVGHHGTLMPLKGIPKIICENCNEILKRSLWPDHVVIQVAKKKGKK